MMFMDQSYSTGRSVFAIVASVFALSLGDALIKAKGLSLPLWQMYILRSAITLPVLLWLMQRNKSLRLHAPTWVIVRSTILVVMWLSYYVSLTLMPLSLAASAYYTGPLFIIGLAALLTYKWPTRRALVAIIAGFLGVILIFRPDTSVFQFSSFLPVFAAFLYACAMVLTSVKCRHDNPFVLALAMNIAFIISGLILGFFSGQENSFIFGPWQTIDLPLVGMVAALASLFLIGSVGAAIAYQNGPPATVAAFDYSYLLFSLVWGSMFFGELPDTLSLVGILVIVGAGFLASAGSKDPRRGKKSII